MKRIVACLIVFAISFSMLVPVYAADEEQLQIIDEVQKEELKADNADNTDNVEDINDVNNESNEIENNDGVNETDVSDKMDNSDKTDNSGDVTDKNEDLENSVEEVHYNWYYKKGSGWYYYNSKGIKQKGWLYRKNIWYYLDPAQDGLMLSDCYKTIGGKEYVFDKSGKMITGWNYVNGKWYYYGNQGKETGWKKVSNVWYYLNPADDGVMLSDCRKTIGGKEYAFNKSGNMITGWNYASGKWYYYGNYGKETGWKKVNNIWYYLNPTDNGVMLSNCRKTINGKAYIFKKDGGILTGWDYVNGKWYYYGNYGKETGWKKVKNIWYYLDPVKNGQMVSKQWKVIGGKWYYLNASGAMATNWLYLGGWFYMGNDGAMRTGWQQIGNDWYYFCKQKDTHGSVWGMMVKNTTVDGIKIGSDGRMANYQDKMAVFSTVSTNDANGTYNMTKALKSFNQVVIMPGQTLSFFGVAGPCGAAQGYLPGGVVGGVGYGGGICQASTTLYGAALRAGMTIVERHNHSVPSVYVPIGQDAMVDYGYSDLKIRNDYTFPVKIVTYVSGNTLYAEIWGNQPGWYDYVNVNSWWTGSRTAIAYRDYVKSGKVVKTEQLPASFY